MTDTLKTVQALVSAWDAMTGEHADMRGDGSAWARFRDEMDKARALIAQMQREAVQPVAVVGSDFTLLWIGSGPIAPIVERHGLRVGSKLYAAPHSEVQALDSQRQPPDDVGGLEYRGNSVSFIHSKMTAYRTAIDEAWAAMRECGHPPDGKTRLADAIRALAAQQQDDHARPVTVQEDRVLRNAALRSSTLVASGKLVDSQQQDDHAGSPAPSEPVAAWLHTVKQNDGGDEDLALSFAPDNFPLMGEALHLFQSVGCVPLYTHPEESSKAALSDDEALRLWNYEASKSGYNSHELPARFARAILARAGIGESRHE